ncbi:MAG: PAS domain-containing protein, partial [Sulfurifustis sp.]
MDNSPGNFIEEVLERMTDAFMAVDSGWRITYVNAAAERIAGRSRCDLLGQPLWEACPDL